MDNWMFQGLVATFLLAATLIAVAPVAAGWGGMPQRQGRVFGSVWALWLVGWACLALPAVSGGPALVPLPLRFPVLFGGPILLGVLMFATLPPLRAAVRSVPLLWLVRWQQCRLIGAFFIVGAFAGVVPWPFALIAGCGDIIVGLAARVTARRMVASAADPVRAAGLARRHAGLGLLDFTVAVSTAMLTHAQIGWPLNLIPLYLVPMAILGHLATLERRVR